MIRILSKVYLSSKQVQVEWPEFQCWIKILRSVYQKSVLINAIVNHRSKMTRIANRANSQDGVSWFADEGEEGRMLVVVVGCAAGAET